jgi:hypothetical protein
MLEFRMIGIKVGFASRSGSVCLNSRLAAAKGLSENKRIEPWFGGSLVKVEDSG